MRCCSLFLGSVFCSEYKWAASHATRGGDGRQEGRERGYYNLHRNLNDSLLHNSLIFIYHLA